MVLVLLGSVLAVAAPPASAHPVQLLCNEPIGYVALGPDLSDLFSVWIASVGTGGACVDYVGVCVYDPRYEPDCSDARHVGVPFCKSCFRWEP